MKNLAVRSICTGRNLLPEPTNALPWALSCTRVRRFCRAEGQLSDDERAGMTTPSFVRATRPLLLEQGVNQAAEPDDAGRPNADRACSNQLFAVWYRRKSSPGCRLEIELMSASYSTAQTPNPTRMRQRSQQGISLQGLAVLHLADAGHEHGDGIGFLARVVSRRYGTSEWNGYSFVSHLVEHCADFR